MLNDDAYTLIFDFCSPKQPENESGDAIIRQRAVFAAGYHFYAAKKEADEGVHDCASGV